MGFFQKREIKDTWRSLLLDKEVKAHAPLREVAFEDFESGDNDGATVFLKELRQRISPRELPSLSKKTIIFANGYTATLKTELTTYLSNCLSIPLLATHRYGRCTSKNGILDSSKRHKRYKQLLEEAEQLIRKNQSIILDGTFADRKWRKVVYNLAKKNSARIVLIKTRCEDEAYIRARLWRRHVDHSRSEHEVTHFRNYEITQEAVQASPVESDEEFIKR